MYLYAGILFLKSFVHVECLFTLAGGAELYYMYRVRHGKNTLAGVDEKFEHTLFTFTVKSGNDRYQVGFLASSNMEKFLLLIVIYTMFYNVVITKIN